MIITLHIIIHLSFFFKLLLWLGLNRGTTEVESDMVASAGLANHNNFWEIVTSNHHDTSNEF